MIGKQNFGNTVNGLIGWAPNPSPSHLPVNEKIENMGTAEVVDNIPQRQRPRVFYSEGLHLVLEQGRLQARVRQSPLALPCIQS